MKEGQQGEATDWWSPVSRQKRGIVSGGGGKRERETNVERVVCCTDWKDCGVDRKLGAWGPLPASAACNCLAAFMSPSCVYWFKWCANTRICTLAGKHTPIHAQQLFSLNLTCVFIKESSCSIVLRSNGDWLWHNYTNPCMNLVLMEAEHLTQTKCKRADQCRGAFFFFFHLSSIQLSPKQDIYICNASSLR